MPGSLHLHQDFIVSVSNQMDWFNYSSVMQFDLWLCTLFKAVEVDIRIE